MEEIVGLFLERQNEPMTFLSFFSNGQYILMFSLSFRKYFSFNVGPFAHPLYQPPQSNKTLRPARAAEGGVGLYKENDLREAPGTKGLCSHGFMAPKRDPTEMKCAYVDLLWRTEKSQMPLFPERMRKRSGLKNFCPLSREMPKYT